MIIQPKVRGFICTTNHPIGCAKRVQDQIDFVKTQKPLNHGPKNVLIIGASTGYGLASRIAAAFGGNAKTIGVSFEKPANGKRTASAGWYNTAAFETAAKAARLYAKSLNGDAFSNEVKQKTIELIQADWDNKIDLIIYSLASPRRQDPSTGKIFNSVLKPIGKTFKNKTVNVMSNEVSEITIEAANQAEIDATVKVMGGEDWQLWIKALDKANLLANNVKTVAYSYIGPELTYPVYRNGTIGKAKEHLGQTADALTQVLKKHHGQAIISVNKALVTQASAAIPVVPLYISLLYKVMKAKKLHEGCIEQMHRLFSERLYLPEIPMDKEGRIRLDDWEMRDDVQKEVETLWQQATTENLEKISDIQGYRDDFYHLFGFGVTGIDYNVDVDPNVAIPSIVQESVTSES